MLTIAQCDALLEDRRTAYLQAVESLDGEAVNAAYDLLNDALDLRLTLPKQGGPLDRLRA